MPSKSSQTPPKWWLALPLIAFGVGVLVWKDAWKSLLLYHALLLVPLGIYHQRWSFQDLFRGFRISLFLIHVVAVIAGFFALTSLAAAKDFQGPVLRSLMGAFGSIGIEFVVYFILVNPVFEEIFWRGLFAAKTKSLTIEDIAFGFFHALILYPFVSAIYIAGGVIGLTAIAWTWRQIRWKTGGIAIPWLGHVLGDSMFAAVVAYLMTR
ncbi:MAG: CPBP family glutamic-type intramembrane protease [Verrucomicrobiota bacterium]